MSSAKVRIEKELLKRAEKAAAAAGYSSADEFITHIIERELAKIEGAADEEDLKNRLKGLGYIS